MRIAKKHWISTIAAVAVFTVMHGGTLAMASDSRARWAGTLTSDTGKTMSVVATFDAANLSLRFSEPGACTIEAGRTTPGVDVRIYRFKVSRNGGPFCAQLYPGELSLTTAADDTVQMRFRRGAATWTGPIEPAGDR